LMLRSIAFAKKCASVIANTRDELLPNSRSLPYSKYLIFYQVRETTIEIIRIAHGYQDLTKLFDN
jgi:plasmid stabilization system protein ParE